MAKQSSTIRAVKAVTKQLGPGLVTGAADDDPSGIATYSRAGRNSAFPYYGPCF
jgi:Mn2+/Fe2+ NRAMP family transporter